MSGTGAYRTDEIEADLPMRDAERRYWQEVDLERHHGVVPTAVAVEGDEEPDS